MSERKVTTELHPFQRVERQRATLLKLIRSVFLIVFLTVAALAILDTAEGEPDRVFFLGIALKGTWQVVMAIALLVGAIAIATDVMTPTKKISTLVSIFFGLVVAMISTYAIGLIIDLLVELYGLTPLEDPVFLTAKVFIGIGLTYICIATVLQTQDDFRLVIPYVEFAKQLRGSRPMLVDSSALIDGRLIQVAHTGIFQAPILIPRFVINELQLLADQSDPIRRSRGRRGLDGISQLQREPLLDVTIDETTVNAKNVDQMLLELARQTDGVIVTTDTGLSRVAEIHGVPVLDMHALAEACKPIAGAGERVRLELVKAGEQPGQAVGYLPEGTMVVVNDAAHLVGQEVTADVESMIQTSAGRMIFARLAPGQDSDDGPSSEDGGGRPENGPAEPDRTSEPQSETDQETGPASENTGAEDLEPRDDGPITQGPFPPKRPRESARAAARRNPRR